MREVQAVLIGAGEYAFDEYGNQSMEEVRYTVYAKEKSVGQKEFLGAGQVGLNPERVLEVWTFEYDGEGIVELDGERYNVYRTYDRSDQKTELYLNRKAGV